MGRRASKGAFFYRQAVPTGRKNTVNFFDSISSWKSRFVIKIDHKDHTKDHGELLSRIAAVQDPPSLLVAQTTTAVEECDATRA